MSSPRPGPLRPFRRILRAVKPWAHEQYATYRRSRLDHIRFIAITGSSGKSTATRLIGAILSSVGRCHEIAGTNTIETVVKTLRKVPHASQFCVQEFGASTLGSIARMAASMRPDVAVVTVVGREHHTSFRTLENTAREKAALVRTLPHDGLAVLNADDPNVSAMAALSSARVVTFGTSEHAEVRASGISSVWPQRLSFTLTWRGETQHVKTRLVGEQWTVSVLAAIACCLAVGVPLKTCIRAAEGFEPLFNRCSVHEAQGATFILDAQKAPYWSIEACMRFMASVRASRKTIVIGTISDYAGDGSRKYRKVARMVLDIANRAVFVGPNAHGVRTLATAETEGRLFMFPTVYDASQFLAAERVDGEVIYLKGSISDHIERLALAQMDEVVCWKKRCGQLAPCRGCRSYRSPSPPPDDTFDYQIPRTHAPARMRVEPPAGSTPLWS